MTASDVNSFFSLVFLFAIIYLLMFILDEPIRVKLVAASRDKLKIKFKNLGDFYLNVLLQSNLSLNINRIKTTTISTISVSIFPPHWKSIAIVIDEEDKKSFLFIDCYRRINGGSHDSWNFTRSPLFSFDRIRSGDGEFNYSNKHNYVGVSNISSLSHLILIEKKTKGFHISLSIVNHNGLINRNRIEFGCFLWSKSRRVKGKECVLSWLGSLDWLVVENETGLHWLNDVNTLSVQTITNIDAVDKDIDWVTHFLRHSINEHFIFFIEWRAKKEQINYFLLIRCSF